MCNCAPYPPTILFQWTPHSKYLTTTPLFPESGWGQSASLGFSNARNCKIKQKLHRTLDIFISAMQCFILYFPVYVRDVKLKLKKLDGLMSTHSRADLMAVLLTLYPTKCQNNVFTSEETLVWDQTNCVHSIQNTKTDKKYHFFSPSIWYKIISSAQNSG